MSGLPFAALVLCLHITPGESQQFTIIVEHSRINVIAGGDALFSVRPSSNVSSGGWSFNGKNVAQWIGQTVFVDNEYTSRAELFTSNWSLLLKSVNMSDSGEYLVNMVPTSGSQTSATVTLRVIGESQQFTIIIEHSQINVTAGGDALFSVRPSSSITNGGWRFNGETVALWIGQTVSFGNEYTSRAELFTSNGSLLLKSVNMSDSGEYRVNMVPTSGPQTSATVTLNVIEPISNVIVTSNANTLIEYDTVTLTCSAAGTDVSYLWLVENSTIIPGGRFEPSADHSMLTVSGVLRTDGDFTCRASNLINELTSGPLYLNVYYGPDRPHILTQPDSSFHVAGSTVRLTCFTESRPYAELNWQLNGAHLQSGQEVILDNISVSHTGEYTCEAQNVVTNRNNASTTRINVLGPVSGVAVVANDSTPLENLNTITLSCDASGTVQTRTWFKNNQPIRENGRIFTSPDKTKLTIISVNRNDAGSYRCIASNSFSSGAGETYVQVYYGPEMVTIVPERPVVSNIASNLTLTCFAQSVPWGIYAWYNGNNLLQTGQELTLLSVSSTDVGSYTCEVTNGITNRNSYRTVHVNAQATKTDGNITLTTGAIVGIALGLLGVGLIGGVTGWLIARKTGGIKNSPQPHYETNSNFGRNGNLDTRTVNASRPYQNFPWNEQGASNNAEGESHTYMTINLADRSVYSDMKR